MSSSSSCRAKTTKGTNCQIRGVLANGFCHKHQYLAVQQILQNIAETRDELNRLGPDVPADKVRTLRRELNTLETELESKRALCSEDQDCLQHLRDVLVAMQDVAYPMTNEPLSVDTSTSLSRLRDLEEDMNDISVGTHPTDAEAFRISQAYELNRRRAVSNKLTEAQLQDDIRTEQVKAQKTEAQFIQGIEALDGQLKANQTRLARSQQIVKSLQKRLDRCQAQSKHVDGVYVDTLSKVQNELQNYKDLYQEQKAREIRVNKRIQQLTQDEQELKAAAQELERSYEVKLAKIRQEFAERSRAGGTVLSSREKALAEEVSRLEALLHQAKDDMKEALKTSQDAVEEIESQQQPASEVARLLRSANVTLKAKNAELGRLSAEADHMRELLANQELRCANNITRATQKDRQDLQRTGNQLAALERQLANKQQEITQLQARQYELTTQSQTRVTQLQNQLRNTQSRLRQLQDQQSAANRRMAQNAQALKTQQAALETQNQYELDRLRESLSQKYNVKAAQLQARFESARQSLDEEKRQMQALQARTTETQKVLQTERAKFERYRSEYQSKMAEFASQRDELMTSLRNAENQATQFTSIEADYKKRVNILRQTIAVQRQQYEARISQLTTKLREAQANGGEIQTALGKCNAAREALVVRVEALGQNNAQLKARFQQLQTRMQTMRAQYEAHLAKLRSRVTSLNNDVQVSAQRLQDASLAHDHVKQMVKECQRFRREVEQKQAQAKGNEKALARLLKDREVGKQQVLRLQTALQDCASKRQELQAHLEGTNTELRDVKSVQDQLTEELRQVSNEYKRTIRTREADMVSQRLRQRTREQELERQLAYAQGEQQQADRRIKTLRKSKQLTENALLDLETQRSKQMQLLIQAQRLQDSDVGTGQSSFVN